MSAPIRSNATKEPIRRLPSLCNSNLPSQGFEKFRTEQLQLVEVPFGGDDGIRTHDLYIANVALYQLSYTPKRGISLTRFMPRLLLP